MKRLHRDSHPRGRPLLGAIIKYCKQAGEPSYARRSHHRGRIELLIRRLVRCILGGRLQGGRDQRFDLIITDHPRAARPRRGRPTHLEAPLSETVAPTDVYGFRTSLTVRHRGIVDRQPVPVTVSRYRTKSSLSQIPILQRASLLRSDCAPSPKSTTAHLSVRSPNASASRGRRSRRGANATRLAAWTRWPFSPAARIPAPAGSLMPKR